MTARTASASRRSAMAVEPVTSAKTSVTTLRTSGGASPVVSGAPQYPHSRNPAGLSAPHRGHESATPRFYWRSAPRNERAEEDLDPARAGRQEHGPSNRRDALRSVATPTAATRERT